MLEIVCFLPVRDQHSDRRRASIQSEDRIAIKDRCYRGSITIPGIAVGRGFVANKGRGQGRSHIDTKATEKATSESMLCP